MDPQLFGLCLCPQEIESEAEGASRTVFLVILVSLDPFKPFIMIPAVENRLKTIVLGDNHEILITLHELLIWEYIAIREEKDRLIAFFEESFYR